MNITLDPALTRIKSQFADAIGGKQKQKQDELDRQFPVNARKTRRLRLASAARQQRKATKRYANRQLQADRDRTYHETLARHYFEADFGTKAARANVYAQVQRLIEQTAAQEFEGDYTKAAKAVEQRLLSIDVERKARAAREAEARALRRIGL